MSRELDCEIVRDLLPLYLEGLTSPETGAAVEAHLAGCPACAKVRENMAAPAAAPAEEGADPARKEVDYLKRVRSRGRLRVMLAVICTVLVLAAGGMFKLFWLGSPATREGMSWNVRADEETGSLELRAYTNWQDTAYREWKLVQQDGVVTITARRVQPSFLCPAGRDYRTSIDLDGVREIWLCGTLLWQDGVTIFENTLAQWETRTPYVGSMSALGKVAGALGVGELCGSFTNELQTTAEPYGWTLHFAAPCDEQQAEALNRQMGRMAVKMLALVENLGWVSWTYSGPEGTLNTRTVTLEQAEQQVSDLLTSRMTLEEGETEDETRLLIPGLKAFAETPAGYQLLCGYLE